MKVTCTVLLVAVAAVGVAYTTVDAAPFISQFRSSGGHEKELSQVRALDLIQKARQLDPKQLKAFLNMDTQKGYGVKPIPFSGQPFSQKEYELLAVLYSENKKDELIGALAKDEGRITVIKDRAKKPVYDLANSVLARVVPYRAKVDDFYKNFHPQEAYNGRELGDGGGSTAGGL
ncbi:hypothetical protein H4R34_004991 [Dimargaris verticillata]|uniref:Uncharacterized protein n=1 Tax=Dimargaris verticillata TaxID=2761393 RepID=A0A9W8EAN0_9FUNG|nr:hypothetical protein H4R34_004991 [Dimargaris verticillata]